MSDLAVRIQRALEIRVFGGIESDDLWVEGESNAFGRVDTEFVRISKTKGIVHVEEEEQLFSFIVTIEQVED